MAVGKLVRDAHAQNLKHNNHNPGSRYVGVRKIVLFCMEVRKNTAINHEISRLIPVPGKFG